MYTYTIEELITALETSIPLDKWKQAYCDIEEKRSMVDNFLVNGVMLMVFLLYLDTLITIP